jgi:hypothetical protein
MLAGAANAGAALTIVMTESRIGASLAIQRRMSPPLVRGEYYGSPQPMSMAASGNRPES